MTVANDVRVEIYRSFIEEGRAPMPADVASRLGMSVGDVTAALLELAGQDVIALVPGTDLLWLAHPFCALDAPFAVTANGRRWDAICIWDALGILALLESDGRIVTRCPDCAEKLNVIVMGGTVEGPQEHVVHYGVAASQWYVDVGYT